MKYKFKYFEEPLKYARFSDEPCDNCGSTNLCLNGTYFDSSEDDIESICLECLVKGEIKVELPSFLVERLHDQIKLKYQHISSYEIQEKVNRILEELSKTPPVPWLQFNDWPVCCGDFMRYIGEWGKEEFNFNSHDGNGKEYLFKLLDVSFQNQIEDFEQFWNEIGEYSIVFVFECMECEKRIAIVQSY
ncbi:uncharacterized protein CbrC (UPF0167 family) [Clostridium pascui]|uniref:CbrC family protein n=1 Tax=Clostridium pascui TaxID=46609 RepID=UPI001956A70B|nr:CbrC family protein [Clostridium pascui]MBM7868533.1 uncharacterized protein CbrC (UPF0167 family) [Clostridium pascui]